MSFETSDAGPSKVGGRSTLDGVERLPSRKWEDSSTTSKKDSEKLVQIGVIPQLTLVDNESRNGDNLSPAPVFPVRNPGHIPPSQNVQDKVDQGDQGKGPSKPGNLDSNPHATPDAKKPGSKSMKFSHNEIEVKQETEKVENKPQINGPRIEVSNRGASPQFAGRIQELADRLPEASRRILANAGIKIVVADTVSSAYPDLKGVRPRGWPPGSTWDNADGLFRDSEIMIAERRTLGDQLVFSNRPEEVFKHESAHAVDAASKYFSRGQEFTAAYDLDRQALKEDDKKDIGYLLQSGNAGKSETFAEILASFGSSNNANCLSNIQERFPKATALMRARFVRDNIANGSPPR